MAQLQFDGTCSVHYTRGPGDAIELARAAVLEGSERVIAIGGDGTVGEVAAGLMGSRVPLGIVPAGTGNDFARGLGLPRRPLAAAQFAIAAWPRLVDVGEISTAAGERMFVNAAGHRKYR